MKSLTKFHRIALIVSSPATEVLFRRNFPNSRIEFHVFRSFAEYKLRAMNDFSFSGVVIDLQTSLLASTDEKTIAREIESAAKPSVKIGVLENDNDIENITASASAEAPLVGEATTAQKNWTQFLDRIESHPVSLNLRTHPRKDFILRAEIVHPTLQHPQRAFTADLSHGGCFIVTPEDWRGTKILQIDFPDLGIRIPCRVAWERDWSTLRNEFPGFGAQFISLSAEHRQLLEKFI